MLRRLLPLLLGALLLLTAGSADAEATSRATSSMRRW
jgi:hypothetical protein